MFPRLYQAEELTAEFEYQVSPYRFVQSPTWDEYNYTHWVIYPPKELGEEKWPAPAVLIGGHSREAEARNIAMRLGQAYRAGRSAGRLEQYIYQQEKERQKAAALSRREDE